MQPVTAALLVIGDEILSGRTADVNIHHIARVLSGIGIDLCEVRVVPDVEAEIVAALNALRARFDYLFTTGGIGPTHDDITAGSVAKALGVELQDNAEALSMIAARYGPNPEASLNEARRRMARIPVGAKLISNPVSGAPGFQIANVIVMAGVPNIMQAMLEHVIPRLKTGTPVVSGTVAVALGESAIAVALAEIQHRNPGVVIGSYPSFGLSGPRCALVVRGHDAAQVERVLCEIETMARDAGGRAERIA
ncbi:MAG: competence/damage-inducible protein A [Alphaproteobacteria bacterium]